MRQYQRVALDSKSLSALRSKQASADKKQAAGILKIEITWKSARRTMAVQAALGALQMMTGVRERCMYCGDSHGTDIDHFWPKSKFPQKMFWWPNMLLCCAECGRIKGDRFAHKDDVPLLIDPTTDDPWAALDYDPSTGNIVARYDPDNDIYIEKGEHTVHILRLDAREALAAGHQRSFAKIRAVVNAVLSEDKLDVLDVNEFIGKLKEYDEYGLLGWCFRGTGQSVAPFSELKSKRADIWNDCLNMLSLSS